MEITTPVRPNRRVTWWVGTVRVLHAAWQRLPVVRPYIGPESLECPPGCRARVFNGRVIITRLKPRPAEPRDGTTTP